MKKIILFLCLTLLCSITVMSQNITKKYSSMTREDGSVYFINPMTGYKCKELPKELEYDITYNTSKDKAVYNFTFYNKAVLEVDSVSFISPSGTHTALAEILYIEPTKKLWEHRVSAHPSYQALSEMYKEETPYQIKLCTKDGNYIFEMKDKEWKKIAPTVRKILEVVEVNRRK